LVPGSTWQTRDALPEPEEIFRDTLLESRATEISSASTGRQTGSGGTPESVGF